MDSRTSGVMLLMVLCTAHAQSRPPAIPSPPPPGDGPSEYLDLRPDGGYRFGYNTGDLGQHQHAAAGSPDGRVAGRYSERGRQTIYTAGPRGFRAQGSHIARRMDLSQTRIPYNPPVNPDSPAYNPTYSGYHDPNEDPSYMFGFRTPTHTRQETSNSNADVTGHYSYVDDVGERHQVDYIAGARTGFHVKTPYPDSLPFSGALFVRAPGKPGQKARGRSAVQRGLDGSYRFTAAGPDQRRTEVSDATGHVRGSYSYLDDKGVQRTTEYIAGPNIGYKVISSKKGPVPSLYPYLTGGFPSPLPPGKDDLGGYLDDVFNTAETGASIKPPKKGKPNSDESIEDISSSGESGGGAHSSEGNKPSKDSTSSASDGNDDLFPSLDQNSDSYGKPTSGYGSSEDSSSSSSSGKPGGTPASSDGAGISSAADFLSGILPANQDSGSKIPYGNCCPAPPRGSIKYHKPPTRKPIATTVSQLASDPYSHVRDFSYQHDEQALVSHHGSRDSYVGFPPGVAVRAHVQSLDILPYGHRLPPPSVALEQLSGGHARRSSDNRRS